LGEPPWSAFAAADEPLAGSGQAAESLPVVELPSLSTSPLVSSSDGMTFMSSSVQTPSEPVTASSSLPQQLAGGSAEQAPVFSSPTTDLLPSGQAMGSDALQAVPVQLPTESAPKAADSVLDPDKLLKGPGLLEGIWSCPRGA
jgi:hypothetical protein